MHDIIIRTMTIDDYDNVAALWAGIKGFGIRSIDDSREGIERFLRRNPNTSVVAEMDGKVVGSILCRCVEETASEQTDRCRCS